MVVSRFIFIIFWVCVCLLLYHDDRTLHFQGPTGGLLETQTAARRRRNNNSSTGGGGDGERPKVIIRFRFSNVDGVVLHVIGENEVYT